MSAPHTVDLSTARVAPPYTLEDLSAMEQAQFVEAVGHVFEHSPWVAERAWSSRPFASLDALHATMVSAMMSASRNEQLALVRAHPELAGKAAVRGELTAESTAEQAGAGLNQCSPEEFERLQFLNGSYVEKFGFPFILAVKGRTRAEIVELFEQRVSNAPEVEFAENLKQIGRIATLRLTDLIHAHP